MSPTKPKKAKKAPAASPRQKTICAEPGCRETATRIKEVVVHRSFCGHHG